MTEAGIEERWQKLEFPKDDPTAWRPLQRLLPDHRDLTHWMLMHSYPPNATEHGERIQAFKHRLTRRYLHIGESGQLYRFDEGTADIVALDTGFEVTMVMLASVLADIEACGGNPRRVIRLHGPDDDRTVLPEFVVTTLDPGCEGCAADPALAGDGI